MWPVNSTEHFVNDLKITSIIQNILKKFLKNLFLKKKKIIPKKNYFDNVLQMARKIVKNSEILKI